MNKQFLNYTILMLSLIILGCSDKLIKLSEENLNVINRNISAIDLNANSVSLNDQLGDGLAIIEDVKFNGGTIEIELKGENIPGKSFVGVAFNIQNDSTYEAIYFRPFNFQSDEKIRREHSLQYIYHPKHSWRYLRTNHEGQYEAEFPRRPEPDDWFKVQIIVDNDVVNVYDVETNTKLLYVKRLTEQVSDNLALWTGFNSKGQFRNLRLIK